VKFWQLLAWDVVLVPLCLLACRPFSIVPSSALIHSDYYVYKIACPVIPTSKNSQSTPPAMVWYVCSIVADTVIAAARLGYLLSAKTGFQDTDKLIAKVCRGVLETGLATTAIVILGAIFFFRMVITTLLLLLIVTGSIVFMLQPLTNMHICFAMIAGKVCTIWHVASNGSLSKSTPRGRRTPIQCCIC
jgi:hypothetical protein